TATNEPQAERNEAAEPTYQRKISEATTQVTTMKAVPRETQPSERGSAGTKRIRTFTAAPTSTIAMIQRPTESNGLNDPPVCFARVTVRIAPIRQQPMTIAIAIEIPNRIQIGRSSSVS